MLKFSIITVSYNSKKRSAILLSTVLAQTYLNVEYIVIDGGSKDNTMGIVGEYRCVYRNHRE